MKVGILTFHRAENFGAVLQAFALQTFLEAKGCQVSIIDYRNLVIDSMYDIYNPRILFTRKNMLASLRLYLSRFRNIHDRQICKEKYDDFRKKYFHQTRKISSIKSIADEFDCIIAGSDQIWNLHLTGGMDRNYFLDFVRTSKRIKKISYAVSAEIDPCNLLFRYRREVSRLLGDFDSLSVREDFLKEELTNYTNKEIKICLDPTFLLGNETYKKMTVSSIAGKYVLVYHMTPIPLGSALADKIASEKGWKVIEIHIGYGFGKGDERHKVNLGPLEILSYLVEADEVITSSFHGLALSLILRKNMWVIDKGNNLRQRSLLANLGLENRLLSCIDDFNENEIDYDTVEKKLDAYIKDSKNFIYSAVFGKDEKGRILS